MFDVSETLHDGQQYSYPVVLQGTNSGPLQHVWPQCPRWLAVPGNPRDTVIITVICLFHMWSVNLYEALHNARQVLTNVHSCAVLSPVYNSQFDSRLKVHLPVKMDQLHIILFTFSRSCQTCAMSTINWRKFCRRRQVSWITCTAGPTSMNRRWKSCAVVLRSWNKTWQRRRMRSEFNS